MRKLLFGLALFGAAFLFAGQSTASAEDEKGWVQLFNGKDLTGWKIHDKPSGDIVEVIKVEKDGKVVGYDGKLKNGMTMHLWRVEDGLLIGSGPASHLFTERAITSTSSIELRPRSTTKATAANISAPLSGPGFPNGYETQINATHRDPVKPAASIRTAAPN